jgi:hypothetical protein
MVLTTLASRADMNEPVPTAMSIHDLRLILGVIV